MDIERRNYPRFGVRSSAFTIFKSEPNKPVPILNISMGGMGIAVNGISMNVGGFIDVSRLEILTDDCHFYMDQLPYQLLLPGRKLTRNDVAHVQHIYGVQFIDLMSSQKNQLKTFIRNHTREGRTPKILHRFKRQLHQFIGNKDFADACRNIGLQRPSF